MWLQRLRGIGKTLRASGWLTLRKSPSSSRRYARIPYFSLPSVAISPRGGDCVIQDAHEDHQKYFSFCVRGVPMQIYLQSRRQINLLTNEEAELQRTMPHIEVPASASRLCYGLPDSQFVRSSSLWGLMTPKPRHSPPRRRSFKRSSSKLEHIPKRNICRWVHA